MIRTPVEGATWDDAALRPSANWCAADTRGDRVGKVIMGRRVESLPVLQEAIYGMKKRLGLDEKDVATVKIRGRTEIRLDSD